MALEQKLLPRGVASAWGLCRRRNQEEFFIGDEAPPREPAIHVLDRMTGPEGAALADLHLQVAQAKASMQVSMARIERLSVAGLAAGLLALAACATWWLAAGVSPPSLEGRTELGFDYFEQTLKAWDYKKTAEAFSDDVRIRFYNQGTREEKIFLGRSGAVELLEYATGLGCARLQDTVVVREIDEAARMVYIAWGYPESVSNFCRPSAETYMFDRDYKISRLNALVDWRLPSSNATLVAFNRFELAQEARDLEAAARAFAEGAVTRFHNLGTGTEKIFRGRAGAKELLAYAQGLGCAKLRDTITAREVDEEARMVYISWKYPASENVSNFCKPSTEVYTFDRDYKISRLNTIVNWRTLRKNPTRDAFNNFHTILKTWDFAKTAETFSHDAVITFYNQGTKEVKTFQGRLGAIELLVYATSLPCAKMGDNITLKKVDEVARTVYTAWEYPTPAANSSGHCGASAEMYMFSEDYEILRLNALVDWGP